jgi:tRNA(fMet)-specific endonuclease VapC
VNYLLDTNTCVQYLRYGNNSPVAARLANANPGDVVLCAVVVGELLFGALRSQNVAKNLADVHFFRAGFVSLSFDDDAAAEYAQIRADLAAKGTPIGPNDMLIAAIALANSLKVVTHNTAEYGRVVGLTIEDWQI